VHVSVCISVCVRVSEDPKRDLLGVHRALEPQRYWGEKSMQSLSAPRDCAVSDAERQVEEPK